MIDCNPSNQEGRMPIKLLVEKGWKGGQEDTCAGMDKFDLRLKKERCNGCICYLMLDRNDCSSERNKGYCSREAIKRKRTVAEEKCELCAYSIK